MTDLQHQIETYLRDTSIPVDVDALVTRPESEAGTTLAPQRASRKWHPAAVFAVASLAVLVLVGGVALLLGGNVTGAIDESSAPATLPPADTTVPGTQSPTHSGAADGVVASVAGSWELTVVETGLEVHDLQSTSFGLVAAAGADGIWIATNGTQWRQVVVMPYVPPDKDRKGEPAQVAGTVESVAEYGGALYAFGTIWTDPDGSEGPGYDKRTIVWRSEDGQQWEETDVDGFPQIIEAAAGPDGLLLVGRNVSHDDPPVLSTVIFRSTDGQDWIRVDISGLGDYVLWAISGSRDGFIALGEASGGRGAVLASRNGIMWEEVGPWTITGPQGQTQPMSYSVWTLVDLIETPYGLLAVSTPEPVNSATRSASVPPVVVLATSIDGQTFDVIDDQSQIFQLEDQRDEPWPPLRPPEGTIVGDQIILLGHSYPDNSGGLAYHQWIWSPLQG